MSELFKNKYRIPSARLATWNYGDNGLYFVTICTKDRECFFGEIVETRCIASPNELPGYEMQLNDLGKIVEREWLKTIEIRPDMNLQLAEHVVMPNHFHGIIHIGENRYNLARRFDNEHRRDAMHCVSTPDDTINTLFSQNKFGPQYKNLASIIRGFKSAVTTFARKNNVPFNWQERFHDHIINSHEEYLRIADYIVTNPDKWVDDKFYRK